jgi:hypothetical protein
MWPELGERYFQLLPADEVARQAVAYAEALILAIEANAHVPRMALNVEAADTRESD